MIVCVVLHVAILIATKRHHIGFSAFLHKKELVAREQSVLILIQSVVLISQYIHQLAINYRLIRYVRERGLVAPL